MKKVSLLTLFTLITIACSPKETPEQKSKEAGISIENAWVKEVPPVQKTSAAYLTIVNNTDEDKILASATNSVANVTELHQMVMDGDVMRMARINSIIIPARSSFELKPGGFHIMLINLHKQLKEGEKVELNLEFESSEKIQIVVPIKKATSDDY